MTTFDYLKEEVVLHTISSRLKEVNMLITSRILNISFINFKIFELRLDYIIILLVS